MLIRVVGWGRLLSIKDYVSGAPVLMHPDPKLQFVVEVDASDSEVQNYPLNALRWTRSFTPAPFSHNAERNYNVGNRELLAAVLTLQK